MLNRFDSALPLILEPAVEFIATWNRKRLPATGGPYVTGIHAPMLLKQTLDDFAVIGSIPAGLCGRYLKLGPNPIDVGIPGEPRHP